MEQQDLNKRLLLALALSFLVFVGYSYLFPPQQPLQNPEQNVASAQSAPAVSSAKAAPNATPSTAAQAVKSAPVTTSNSLVTVVSDTFKMNIDELGRIAQFELLEKKYQNAEGHNLQILGADKAKPLEIRFADVKLNEEAFHTLHRSLERWMRRADRSH